MIIGLTRVRNEQAIIKDTLDHMATFCESIIVYDDASTDDTAIICENHYKVVQVIRNENWDKNRARAEWQSRGELVSVGKNYAGVEDWFVYMDADERIEFDWDLLKMFTYNVIGIRMKLFDFYITEEDVDLPYSHRKKLGPEYRNILMVFRNLPTLDYSSSDQREVHLRHPGVVPNMGFVRHYGKAVSVQQWEDTCEYYASHFPKYSKKWNARRGKAVHSVSSFGMELISWDQKEEKGILLTKEIESKNIYG